MKALVKTVLDDLVSRISAETTTRFVRGRLFTDGVDIPCRRWSMLNQLFVALADTVDARGMRQWNAVGRRVVKGAKALYIIIPMIVPLAPQKESSTGTKDEEDTSVLAGFRTMPVFRMEDTEGDILPYQIKMKAFDISSLPLIEVAKDLGVKVRLGATTRYSGVYRGRTKEIILGTDDPQVFLHELSHAIDGALPGRRDDYAFGEVVAELSSCFLGSLCSVPVSIGATTAYIQGYAGKGHVAFQIAQALGRVESIYKFIETATKRRPIKVVRAIQAVSSEGVNQTSLSARARR